MSQEVDSSPRYVRNPDVVLREEDEDGALLFNPDTNQIRVLNASGVLVWNLLDREHEVSSIASAMRETFDDVPEDKVESHIQEFIESMFAGGFVSSSQTESD